MQSYRNLNILHGQYFLSSHVTFQQVMSPALLPRFLPSILALLTLPGLTITQDLNTYLTHSFFLILPARAYCVCLFYLDACTAFTSCTWRFYPDQLHLAVLPWPILCFLYLVVLPRPAALDGFNPTNYWLFVPGGCTPTSCIWWFYPDQSFTSCAWRFYPDHQQLAVLTLALGGSIPTICTWLS